MKIVFKQKMFLDYCLKEQEQQSLDSNIKGNFIFKQF